MEMRHFLPLFGFCLVAFADGQDVLSVIAHQKLAGESLPSCSIAFNETIEGRFRRLDTNDDGEVDFADFLFADQCAVRERKARFDRIDINYDHFIDREEWRAHCRQVDVQKRQATFEENKQLFAFFDRDHNGLLDAKEVRKFVRFRRCNPTNLDSYLAGRALNVAELDAFSYLLPSDRFPLGRRNRTRPRKPDFGDGECRKPETHDEEFRRLDSDKNHKISFGEFLFLERCPIYRHRRKFRQMDRNGNGYLTMAEFKHFYSNRDRFWQGVYRMRMNGVVHKYDTNSDMRLDAIELRQFLHDRKLDPRNVDFVFRARSMSPEEFADWEETLPNLQFPPIVESKLREMPKLNPWTTHYDRYLKSQRKS